MAVSDIPRVLSLLDQGKSAEALELSARLIEEMPTHVTSYVVHARANESQGQYEAAFRSWRRAMDLLPNSPQIKKGLLRTADKLARPPAGDFDFMRWTREKNQINVHQYEYAPGTAARPVDPDLLHDPLVTDSETPPTDDSHEVPEFVDTDLPDSDSAYELYVSGGDSSEEDHVIEESDERPFVVSSSPEPGFEPELVSNASGSDEAETDGATGTSRRVQSVESRVTNNIEESTGAAELDSEAETLMPDSHAADLTMQDHDAELHDEYSRSHETELRGDRTQDDAADHDGGHPQDHRADVPSERPAKSPLDDLDSLIVELESARIVPRPDDDPAPAANLDNDVEGMVSETLARIFASQSQFAEAARIYEKLSAVHPGRADEFRTKAAAMRQKAE